MRPLLVALAVAGSLSLGGCALIAAPIMQDQQAAAQDSLAQSDVLNAKIAYVSIIVETGTAPTEVSELTEAGYVPSEGVSEVRMYGNVTAFCLEVTAATGHIFKTTDTEMAEPGACTDADY